MVDEVGLVSRARTHRPLWKAKLRYVKMFKSLFMQIIIHKLCSTGPQVVQWILRVYKGRIFARYLQKHNKDIFRLVELEVLRWRVIGGAWVVQLQLNFTVYIELGLNLLLWESGAGTISALLIISTLLLWLRQAISLAGMTNDMTLLPIENNNPPPLITNW